MNGAGDPQQGVVARRNGGRRKGPSVSVAPLPAEASGRSESIDRDIAEERRKMKVCLRRGYMRLYTMHEWELSALVWRRKSMNEEPTSKLPENLDRTEEARSSPVTGSAVVGPCNPVLRDPDDFGSREFWKAANAHAVRWEAEKVAQMQELIDWAESLICNAVPMSNCTQDEWNEVVNKWRDAKHGVGGWKDSPNAGDDLRRERE